MLKFIQSLLKTPVVREFDTLKQSRYTFQRYLWNHRESISCQGGKTISLVYICRIPLLIFSFLRSSTITDLKNSHTYSQFVNANTITWTMSLGHILFPNNSQRWVLSEAYRHFQYNRRGIGLT